MRGTPAVFMALYLKVTGWNIKTAAAVDYLAAQNKNPKRYVWKAEGEKILAKIRPAREILIETHSE